MLILGLLDELDVIRLKEVEILAQCLTR
jgi:hypothetical protein